MKRDDQGSESSVESEDDEFVLEQKELTEKWTRVVTFEDMAK